MRVEDLYYFLLGLPVEDFLPLIVGLLLLRKYFQTRIVDYLVFSNVFIFSYFAELFTYLSRDVNVLEYYQLTFISVHITYMWLLVHVHRIKKVNLQSPRFAVEMIWAIIIVVLILNWKLMLQPETSTLFGFEIDRGSSIYFPRGAGIYLFDGQMLVSTAHADFIYLFWVYVNGYAVYSYATLDLKIDTATTRKVRRLWLIAFSFAFVWTLSVLSIFYFSEITNLLVIIAFFIEIYIAFRYPEAMLLSHVQVQRAVDTIEDHYDQLGESRGEVQLQQQLDRRNQDVSQVEKIYINVDYSKAIAMFPEKTESPHALYILTKSRMIDNFCFSEEFQEGNELVGNLISAILSFADEIMSPDNISRTYRFQSEQYNLIAIRMDRLILCYVFEGFPPLAEIRLVNFIDSQTSDQKKRSKWENSFATSIVMLDETTKSWLRGEIAEHFLHLDTPEKFE